MADSNITKKALANALKELMTDIPFEKINVAQICEKCNMNRKSFYYHFKDKYDLVNWIFDVEVLSVMTQNADSYPSTSDTHWNYITNLCTVFYNNRSFYRKAFKIKGQNSFSEHFRDCIYPLVQSRISFTYDEAIPDTFVINFLTDACVCALERWISDKNCISPEEFSSLLRHTVQTCATIVYNEEKQTHD